MKNTDKDCLEEYNPQIPNKALYKLICFVYRIILRFKNVRFYYHFNKKEMKRKQVILVADHACHLSGFYTIAGYYFVPLNTVTALRFFYKKWLSFLLRFFGFIPKSLFEPDILCVRKMMSILKKGGSLCFFPEGIESVSGSNLPINPGTVDFLKANPVTVVLCKSHGEFLKQSSFGGKRRGPVEIHFDVLFTPEELKSMDKENIYNRLLERFSYNEFEWNREKEYSYYSKQGNAEGLQNLLYICPKCHHVFTLKTEHDFITCTSCENLIKIEDSYALSPEQNSIMPYRNIDEWYKDQRIYVRKLIQNKDFCVTYPCKIEILLKDKIRKNPVVECGDGEITIDATGISYNGIVKGETTKLFFPILAVPCFYAILGKSNELCFQRNFFKFIPINSPEKVVFYMMIVEELHNMVDPRWKKASEDVCRLRRH